MAIKVKTKYVQKGMSGGKSLQLAYETISQMS